MNINLVLLLNNKIIRFNIPSIIIVTIDLLLLKIFTIFFKHWRYVLNVPTTA